MIPLTQGAPSSQIQTESRMGVARTWGTEHGELLFNGYGVSDEEEKGRETDGGGGGTQCQRTSHLQW